MFVLFALAYSRKEIVLAENHRLQAIRDMARRDGKVSTDSIAQAFDVTVQTARRDLTKLCANGQLTRVYGGAVLPSGTRNIRYTDRQTLNASSKIRMARAAANMIPDGASVFLDIGTTLEAVAHQIHDRKSLVVITNNLHVANILSTARDIEVVLAGGILRATDGGLVGDVTAEFVRHFRPDIAFLGASALSDDGDALDFDFREVRVAQAVMRLARRSVLLADQSKFARSAPVRIGKIAEYDGFISDAPLSAELNEQCKLENCEVTTV